MFSQGSEIYDFRLAREVIMTYSQGNFNRKKGRGGGNAAAAPPGGSQNAGMARLSQPITPSAGGAR